MRIGTDDNVLSPDASRLILRGDGGSTSQTESDGTVTVTLPPAGGGSQPGAAIVRGPFAFAFDTLGVGVQTCAVTALNQGTPSFTIAGDLTDFIEVGDVLTLSGSTLNDSTYTVVSAAVVAGATVITVAEAIADATADGSITVLAGIPFYTPTVGDIVLDGWIEVTTAWDGISNGDFGPPMAGTYGVLGFEAGQALMTLPDYGDPNSLNLLVNDQAKTDVVIANANTDAGYRILPGKVLTTRPWRVWVTQSGQRDGAASGAAAGTARVYLVTATPVAFS